MTQEIRFPFRLNNAFFTSLEFERISELPERLDLSIGVQAKISEDEFPDRLQVHLRIKTVEEESPLTFCVELIGLFDLIEDQPEPDRSIITEFVNERALYILWPHITQMVRIVTGQMGTNPINVNTPFEFHWRLPEGETIESSEEEKMG
jgi:preprotein translocase subunit SecB